MERRNFLRAMLGVAAATALPSEVWPFRKIFVPAAPRMIMPDGITITPDLKCSLIQAIQLETFSREIPDLYYRSSPLYMRMKQDVAEHTSGFYPGYTTVINPALKRSAALERKLDELVGMVEDDDDVDLS